jgi:hypothetical protein
MTTTPDEGDAQPGHEPGLPDDPTDQPSDVGLPSDPNTDEDNVVVTPPDADDVPGSAAG